MIDTALTAFFAVVLGVAFLALLPMIMAFALVIGWLPLAAGAVWLLHLEHLAAGLLGLSLSGLWFCRVYWLFLK